MLVSEIARFLNNNAIGIFDETGISGDIFTLTLPATPDNAIAIYHRGGLESDIKLGYDSPNVQFIVRGTQDPRQAYARALSIYNLLHGFEGYFIEEGTYVVSCIGTQSGPVPIGKDENGRHEFSINFRLEVRNILTNKE